MANTVTWSSPDQVQTAQGQTNPGIVYIVDPATGKVVSLSTSSGIADLSASGTISAAQATEGTPVANATVVLTVGSGQSTWKAQLLAGGGGFTSGTTIVADKSPDNGTTWYSASFKVAGASPATPVSSVVGPGPIEMTGDCAGVTSVRIRCSVLNSTETVAVVLRASTGASDVGLISSIPAGTNTIGGVTQSSGPWTQNLTQVGGATVALGQTTKSASVPVTIASDQSNANGQATMANSAPVTIASDQSAVPTRNVGALLYSTTQTGISATADSGDIDVSKYTRVFIIANLTGFTGTSIQFRARSQDAFSTYFNIASPAALTSSGNAVLISLGDGGLVYGGAFGNTIRVQWVCTAVTTATFTVTVYAK